MEFQRKSRDERVPTTPTIHNFVNKRRSTGHLIGKEQKHKRRELTEES
jgi:hypothetical protein